MTRPLNVGLVGYGAGGSVYHAPIINSLKDFKLKKVVERHKEHSKKKYPWVEVVKDFKELLVDEEIELVVIAVPNHLHFSMAYQAIEAGKHVVVDKPFTTTYAEAIILCELARKNNKILSVYHNRRLDDGYAALCKFFKAGQLGAPLLFESRFDRYRPEIKQSWRETGISGAGLVYDLGPHLIDHVLNLLGMPLSIKADIQKQRPGVLVDDFFRIQFFYEGFNAEATAGMLVKEKTNHLFFKGTKASFTVPSLDGQEVLLKNGIAPAEETWEKAIVKGNGIMDTGGSVENIELPLGDYTIFYKNIRDAIDGKAALMVKPEEAANVLLIIEKAFLSAQMGEQVYL